MKIQRKRQTPDSGSLTDLQNQPVGSHRLRAVCWAVLALSALVTGVVRAEVATEAEMEQVCRNWLTQMVYHKGNWAGSDSPEISAVHEITSGDTLLARYYDISPRGFVAVSVLKEMTPVKAYSDKSSLDADQEEGFISLLREVSSERLSLYASTYGNLEATQPESGEAIFGRGQREVWDRYVVSSEEFTSRITRGRLAALEEAGPFLSSNWHQGAPYNNYCPMGDGGRCVVGCVATATAQILYYWQWPPSGIGTYSYIWSGDQSCDGNVGGGELSADFSDEYDWANMLDSCDDGCSPAEAAALAELNSEVGIAFGMDYGACGSGASTARAAVVFPTFFKYSMDVMKVDRSDYSLDEWFLLVQEEVNAGRPIQYRINRHSIVCDGWRDQGSQYEFHMVYGWSNSFTTWYVLDSLYCSWIEGDVCPADEEYMITHIEPQTQPVIELVGYEVDDGQGDGDGHADVGEVSEIMVTICNNGWNAEDAVGQLTSEDPYVTVTTTSAAFESSIPWGGEAGTITPFAFSVDPSCPDPHWALFELEVSAAGGYTTYDTFCVFIGDTPGFHDDFESGEGFWSHKPIISTYVDQWHLEDYRANSGVTCWKAGGTDESRYADLLDGGLLTPPFLLPTNARLSFWHWLSAEIDSEEGMAWDGAIVMISTGVGQWTQVTPEGGYPYAIVDNPASPFEGGTPCFSGNNDWTQVEYDLSDYSGVVQVMFRLGTDGATTEEGWYIDDIDVSSAGCCVNLTGNIDCSPGDEVDLSDLTRLIDYLFISFSPLCCPEEANLDGSGNGVVDLSDLTALIGYLFVPPFTPPVACPY